MGHRVVSEYKQTTHRGEPFLRGNRTYVLAQHEEHVEQGGHEEGEVHGDGQPADEEEVFQAGLRKKAR
jgi:hypothetical protein